LYTLARSPYHLQIDAKFAPVMHVHAGVLRHVGVQHGRDVVFDVTCGEQHAGQRQYLRIALLPQRIQGRMDDRRRKFEEAMIDIDVGQAFIQHLRQNGEFADGIGISATMPTK